MDNHSSATTSLRDRIQSLPQELYDMVYDLTFKLPSGAIDVHKNYKLPFQLHINRAIREDCAQRYFSNHFNFPFRDVYTDDLAVKFLTAIPKAYVQLIPEMKLIGTFGMHSLARWDVMSHLCFNYHELSPRSISSSHLHPHGDESGFIRIKFERPLY